MSKVIRLSDLRIDTYGGAGPAKDWTGTMKGFVRVTHLPTGTMVKCEDDDTFDRNKRTALKKLLEVLNAS